MRSARSIFLGVCFAAFAVLTLAQQNAASASSGSLPPTTAEVMNYFEVMHVHEQALSMIDAQQKQMRIILNDMFNKEMPEATPEKRKQFDDMMNGAMDDVFKNYPIDDMLRDMVPVYQRHLTESDLNAIVTFYSSPVGQKLRREMPAMMSEGMRVSYVRLQPKLDEMMKNIKARIEKMGEEEKATKTKN